MIGFSRKIGAEFTRRKAAGIVGYYLLKYSRGYGVK